MTRYQEYCQRQRGRYGDKFVAPKAAQFVAPYNNGDCYRVKVRTTYASGETHERWGYVALTTGWRPSFMLMSRRGQHGSSDLIDERDVIVCARWID
jgi:hypothetical protein